MNAFAGFCLCTLITFAVTLSISVTLTLTANIHGGPRFFVKEFYVPALDLSQSPTTSNNNNKNTFTNNTIITNPCLFFDLAFVNIDDEHSVRYGDVNLTFSYGGRNNNAVANYVVRSFDQGWWEVDYRREVVESRGVPWEDAVKAVSNGSTVVFRVDLAARPKFWEGMWYSKKKRVRIGADVEVDGTGLKVKKKDIRLNSAAFQRGVGIYVLFLSLLVAWKCLFF
ncbi:hypothetical protein ABFS83_13G026100 [Erythranthe nasuta]